MPKPVPEEYTGVGWHLCKYRGLRLMGGSVYPQTDRLLVQHTMAAVQHALIVKESNILTLCHRPTDVCILHVGPEQQWLAHAPRDKTGEVAEGLCGGLPGPEPTEARALSAAWLAVVLPLPPSPLLLCPEAPNPPLWQYCCQAKTDTT